MKMKNQTLTLAPFDESLPDWERALYAFLAEKERRSGSRRTVEGYSRMLQQFFGSIGKPPERITSPEVFTYAYGIGLSGKEPSSVTIGARIACLSSFWRFLMRMGLVASNPCDQVERPRAQPSLPRGLSAEEIKRLLAAITTTPTGLRDRAIVLTLTLTGRRRSEVMNLKAGDISCENGTVYYAYRGKGGKQGKRELPRPAFTAIEQALAAWAKSPITMDQGESLWPTDDPGRAAAGLGITSGTFYGNLRRYFRKAGLPPAGVHILRHAAAKLRRDVGESIEDISRFLDHSSLAVTTVYLRQLEGQEDKAWSRVAEAIGV
jgi:integrase/recombinase XerC